MALKILSLSTLLLIGNISMVNANPNMRFYGELVDDPCVINPGDETVILTFGNVPENFFIRGSAEQIAKDLRSIYQNVIFRLIKKSE